MFYKGVTINHCTHVPVTVAQYSSDSEYNEASTAEMDLSHFRMLNNEWFSKDPEVVLEQATLIILESKSAI